MYFFPKRMDFLEVEYICDKFLVFFKTIKWQSALDIVYRSTFVGWEESHSISILELESIQNKRKTAKFIHSKHQFVKDDNFKNLLLSPLSI